MPLLDPAQPLFGSVTGAVIEGRDPANANPYGLSAAVLTGAPVRRPLPLGGSSPSGSG